MEDPLGGIEDGVEHLTPVALPPLDGSKDDRVGAGMSATNHLVDALVLLGLISLARGDYVA